MPCVLSNRLVREISDSLARFSQQTNYHCMFLTGQSAYQYFDAVCVRCPQVFQRSLVVPDIRTVTKSLLKSRTLLGERSCIVLTGEQHVPRWLVDGIRHGDLPLCIFVHTQQCTPALRSVARVFMCGRQKKRTIRRLQHRVGDAEDVSSHHVAELQLETQRQWCSLEWADNLSDSDLLLHQVPSSLVHELYQLQLASQQKCSGEFVPPQKRYKRTVADKAPLLTLGQHAVSHTIGHLIPHSEFLERLDTSTYLRQKIYESPDHSVAVNEEVNRQLSLLTQYF